MLKPLTSLRFVFAFMVFSGHLGGLFLNYNENFLVETNARYLSMREGYLGVSFFFILSGFILSYKYKESFVNKTITFRKFILSRIFRIYPLHVLTFAFTFYLTYYNNLDNIFFWIKSMTNLFLIQSFIPIKEYFFSFNGVSWSISNEMFFYLIFPLLIALFSKWKKYALFLLMIPLAIIIYRPSADLNHWGYYINPIFRAFDFFLGIILYDLYSKYGNREVLKKNATILEIGVVVLFLIFYTFRTHVSQDFRWSLYYWIPMASLIFIFGLQSGAISKLISKRFFIWLGEISFAFYMIHQIVINVLWIINYKFEVLDNGYVLILSALLVSVLGSGILFKYFEMPINRYLRKKYIKP